MILLDTNVLVYALNADSPHHPQSRAVVEAALGGRLPGVLVPQVLLEAFAELVAFHKPVAQEVFDVFLVAQMRAHGIATLCTYDVEDFRRYPGLAALTPPEVLRRLP